MEATFDLRGTWMENRLGKFTSSEMHKLFSEPRSKTDKEAGKLSDSARTFVLQKAGEILSGQMKEISNQAIEWGEMNEGAAYLEYTRKYGSEGLEYFGGHNPKFFDYKDIAGGSLDFKGPNLAGEIKCPFNTENHLKYLLIKDSAELKKVCFHYWVQLQSNMFFADCDHGVFVSFDPRLIKRSLTIHCVDVHKDDEFREQLVLKIESAEQHLKTILETLIDGN